jgi:hypothetical protein
MALASAASLAATRSVRVPVRTVWIHTSNSGNIRLAAGHVVDTRLSVGDARTRDSRNLDSVPCSAVRANRSLLFLRQQVRPARAAGEEPFRRAMGPVDQDPEWFCLLLGTPDQDLDHNSRLVQFALRNVVEMLKCEMRALHEPWQEPRWIEKQRSAWPRNNQATGRVDVPRQFSIELSDSKRVRLGSADGESANVSTGKTLRTHFSQPGQDDM